MAVWNGCEKSICDMIVLSVPQNGFFFHRAEFFTCHPSLSCEISPDFYPTWPTASGAEHQTKFGAAVEENC